VELYNSIIYKNSLIKRNSMLKSLKKMKGLFLILSKKEKRYLNAIFQKFLDSVNSKYAEL